MLSDITLPISAMLIGLLSLATPAEARGRFKYAAIVLIVILQIVVCGATIVSQSKDKSDLLKQSDKLDKIEDANVKLISEVGTTHQTVAKLSDQLGPVYTFLLNQGYRSPASATGDQIDHSLSAARAIGQVAAQARPTDSRTKESIEVFSRDVDRNVVLANLRNLGFAIIERPAIARHESTNKIWYSTDIPSDDIKLVALTLISAGVSIKAIQPIPLSYQKLCQCSLEVGGDHAADAFPTITIEQIKAGGFPIPP
jgi:hypothetical protein